MFERLTTEAKAAIADAHLEARRGGAAEIDSGHLLVAMALDAETVSGSVLAELAARPEDLRAQLDGEVGPVDFDDEDREALASIGIDLDEVQRRLGNEPFSDAAPSPRAKPRLRRRGVRLSGDFRSAIEGGVRRAVATRSKKVRCEDLLVGIVNTVDGVGAAALGRRGIRASDVHQAIATRAQTAS